MAFVLYAITIPHEQLKSRLSGIIRSRTDTRRMTVDRKLTFSIVRHEIHRLFRLYSLVNQDMRTESCTAGHRICMLL